VVVVVVAEGVIGEVLN